MKKAIDTILTTFMVVGLVAFQLALSALPIFLAAYAVLWFLGKV